MKLSKAEIALLLELLDEFIATAIEEQPDKFSTAELNLIQRLRNEQ